MKFYILATLSLIFWSCKLPKENISPNNQTFKEEMRQLVQTISKNAKAIKSNFVIIPQNGIELLKIESGEPSLAYLLAVDGLAIPGLNYGYESVDQANTHNIQDYINYFVGKNNIGTKPIYSIEYCTSDVNIKNAFTNAETNNYKLFISSTKSFGNIPNSNSIIFNETKNNIDKIETARNFMIINDFSNYTKAAAIENLVNTNYDIIVIDGFYKNTLLEEKDIKVLKTKKNGGKRLVLVSLPTDQANLNRYYWQESWKLKFPTFVNKEIGLDGNIRVNYWQNEWQNILYGNETSLINKFIKLGFDGAYLTGIEAYSIYE